MPHRSARTSQSVSSCSLHANDVDTWVVEGAPAPFELLWANLRLTGQERRRRGLVLWAAFVAMTLFFMIPVAAVQVGNRDRVAMLVPTSGALMHQVGAC